MCYKNRQVTCALRGEHVRPRRQQPAGAGADFAASRERELDVQRQGQLMMRASSAAAIPQLKLVRTANYHERVLEKGGIHIYNCMDPRLREAGEVSGDLAMLRLVFGSQFWTKIRAF